MDTYFEDLESKTLNILESLPTCGTRGARFREPSWIQGKYPGLWEAMEAGLDQILADQVQNSQREHVVTVRAKAREFVDVREQIAKYISVTLEKKPPSNGHVHYYYQS